MVVFEAEGGAVGDRAEAEFSEFMQGRWPTLVRFGYGLTGDVGLAEDLAQTALARAYASWPRVRRAGDPDAYVRKIMLNANHSRFRKRRVAESPAGLAPGCETAGPAGQRDDRAALMAALRGLPHGQRAVVLLRYWMDMTETEVATALGCSVGNVKSQASRALAKLRASAGLADGVSHEHQ
jgi:RNA polymerase sigma-70 factor (sigma-E family)